MMTFYWKKKRPFVVQLAVVGSEEPDEVQVAVYIKNDEFRIKNDEFRIRNDGLCFKMMD